MVDLRTTADVMNGLVNSIERVIFGKRQAAELAVIALFSGHHLLIDDAPGVGKTMLARSIARSIAGTFSRIQGTSDLLPTDITGTVVYHQSESSFRFVPGPVFANVVLFDEINRATPKTQSALLQVMDEGCVAADGNLHDVPRPFFVVATQNPLEHHGTFPLPEGELDRFGLSMAIGYPDQRDEEHVVASQLIAHPIDELEPIVESYAMAEHQVATRTVHVDPGVLEYAVAITRGTRHHAELALGSSPRGSIAITRSAQARALLAGRDYVLPDDVKALASAALAHRIVDHAHSASVAERRRLIDDVIESVHAPPRR